MKLVSRLAQHALEKDPDRATLVLERLEESETARLLEQGGIAPGVAVLQRLSPHYGAAVLSGLDAERGARILGGLPADAAARVLRRVAPDVQESLLGHVEPKRARALQTLLRFREGTAGALMDPDVLALPHELSAREALQRVRKVPELARYNLYVVDPAQSLVGALNLRELLLARGRQTLAELMTRDPHRVNAAADRASVVAHPGWKEVHSLPVVDDAEAFLGAIRYRVVRRLEEEFLRARSEDIEASAAFGQVIAAGARGLLDAVSGAVERREEGRTDGAR